MTYDEPPHKMTFHFVMSHLLQDECARILRRSSVRDAGVGVIASSLAIVYYWSSTIVTTGLTIPTPAHRSVGG
jgi:hypothetical protein